MLRNFKGCLEKPRFEKPISHFLLKTQFVHHLLIPSETNYSSLLINSIRTKSLQRTQQTHSQIIINSLLSDSYLSNLIVEAYFKCGESHLAFQTFDQMPHRDSATWALVIAHYSQTRQPEKSLRTFRSMIEDRQNPNRSSLISTLTSCRNLLKRVEGRQLHSQVVKRIPPADVILGNVLIAFYARCGDIDEALRAFDEITKRDLVSWNSMLSGYLQRGLYREAWEFFAMMHRQYIGFSDDSFSAAAKCCGSFRGAREGEELHCLAVKAGFESHVVVASALLDMYSKCGEIGMARKVFDSMAEPNVVSWTSIITGCVRCDRGEDALRLFRDQLRIGIHPDPYSFSSIVSACANLPALLFGRSVHALAVRSGYEFETFTCNSLVEMYSRCGCLSDARRVHDSMGVRDVITWTSMISGCAQHGEGQTALEIFERMIREGVKPNWVTFVAVLSACGRSGLVDEGVYHFRLMGEVYGVEAREEHYTCLVDLLARAGRVHEAYEIIKERMPFKAGASTWGALLNGCRVIGELKLGLICAEELLVLEPNTASNHVLLANMYAKNGMWEEMGRVRGLMKEKGLKKESGYSWIEVGKEMYVFGAGDSQHALHEFMFDVLRCLSEEMEENSERFHDIEMDVWFQI